MTCPLDTIILRFMVVGALIAVGIVLGFLMIMVAVKSPRLWRLKEPVEVKSIAPTYRPYDWMNDESEWVTGEMVVGKTYLAAQKIDGAIARLDERIAEREAKMSQDVAFREWKRAYSGKKNEMQLRLYFERQEKMNGRR